MLARFISAKEDTLTASVFGHLLHLPIETFWSILRRACNGHELPEHCGEPLLIDPWPKWSPEGTDNSRYIEPDLFLRFEDFDLIIEAKRWDGGMQSHSQWRNQLISYHHVHGAETEERTLHYLALGGLWKSECESLDYQVEIEGERVDKKCLISKARWLGILTQSQHYLQHLKSTPFPSSQDLANQRILQDLIDLFARHGFSTGRWYEDFDFLRNRPTHRPESRSYLIQLHATFS